MGTHRSQCVRCDRRTYCTSEAAALGVQGGCHESDPEIEFCSIGCFKALRDDMTKRLEIAESIAADPEDAGFMRKMLDSQEPTREIVAPDEPIFAAYPRDIAAYKDDGVLVIRARHLYRESALEFARWINDHFGREPE